MQSGNFGLNESHEELPTPSESILQEIPAMLTTPVDLRSESIPSSEEAPDFRYNIGKQTRNMCEVPACIQLHQNINLKKG